VSFFCTKKQEPLVTAQWPDKLVNKHPRVKFDGLHLYGVIRGDFRASRGDWGDADAFTAKPSRPANAARCSALWRGYVATFLLQEDGRLRLVVFDYLLGLGKWQKQEVDEFLAGDFWMVMKPEFFAPPDLHPIQGRCDRGRSGAVVHRGTT
jgi:hypothetical protein